MVIEEISCPVCGHDSLGLDCTEYIMEGFSSIIADFHCEDCGADFQVKYEPTAIF